MEYLMHYLERLWNIAVGKEKSYPKSGKYGVMTKTILSMDVGDYIFAGNIDERNSIYAASHHALGKSFIKTKHNKKLGGWICTRVK
jgi:hypothetical protein